MKLLSILSIIIMSFCFLGMSQKPVTPKKLKRHNSHKHGMKATGKSLGYFQIKIDKFDNGNGDVQFRAQILPQKDMDGEFKWQLPENVKILSGDLVGNQSFKKDQVITQEITIDKESLSNNDQIFFFAYKMMNGERHGGSYSLVYKSDDSSDDGFQKSQVQKKKAPKFYE